jgi:hypothetical protein
MELRSACEYEEVALDTVSVQLISTLVIIVGLLFAMFALMWQMNSQSNRLEAKIDAQGKDMDAQGKELEAKIDAQSEGIDAQGKELEAKIDAQGKELRAQIDAQGRELEAKIDAQSEGIDAQGKELEAKIDAQGKELRAEIIAQGRRVSDSELEQARLNGINSVLTQFAHTHEVQAGDD